MHQPYAHLFYHITKHTPPTFASNYGFKAVERINEIKQELNTFFGVPVDFADRTGMGKTAKKFIIDRAVYV